MPGSETELRVQIEPTSIHVRPGGQSIIQVRVVNFSGIVDAFEISLVGAGHPGLGAEPQNVKLLKNQERVVPLLVRASIDNPPPAGRSIVGVRVHSVSNPTISWVEELDVAVTALGTAVMTLEPARVKGGHEATLLATVSNQSNQAVNLGFAGTNTDSAVEFSFTPRAVFAMPGQQHTVLVRVRASPPFSGADAHRTISVAAIGDQVQLPASATFVQSPRISAGVLRVLGSIGVLVLLGGAILAAALIGQNGDNSAVDTTTLPPEAPLAPTVAAAQQVPVPNVQGLDVNSAGQALAAAGLTAAIQPQADPNASVGTVVGSQPATGTALQPGSTVTLLVSSGPDSLPTAEVPTVEGLTVAEANLALATACDSTPCFVSDLSSAFSDDVRRDLVIGSTPGAGEEFAVGGPVTLIVSLGPEEVNKPDTAVTPIVGNWVNTTPGIGEITRMVVRDANGEPLVQAFKRCGTEECSIDQDLGVFNGTDGSVELADTSFRYDIDFASVGETLEVDTQKTFNGPVFTAFTIDPAIFLQPIVPADPSPSPGTTQAGDPPPPAGTTAIFRRG